MKQADPEFYQAFNSMLHDYIVLTSPRKSMKSQQDLSDMIRLMADVVNHAEPTKAYTTGELARIFGVSVQAINNNSGNRYVFDENRRDAVGPRSCCYVRSSESRARSGRFESR